MSRISIRELADGGLLHFDPGFLSPDEADALLDVLLRATPWRVEPGLFGRPMPRRVAYFADPGVEYRYSGVTHASAAWPDHLIDLRLRVEEVAGAGFNSVLLNHYRDGQDSMGWHADDEEELGPNPVVPSVSLGSERRFLLRHLRSRETVEYRLGHGSLLVMAGTTQHHWHHSVPKTKRPVGGRVNLTFRQIHPASGGPGDG